FSPIAGPALSGFPRSNSDRNWRVGPNRWKWLWEEWALRLCWAFHRRSYSCFWALLSSRNSLECPDRAADWSQS
ncbi:hypothetical protein PMAYCL1PPCAC_31807, partial [Pristionchus mayeri]